MSAFFVATISRKRQLHGFISKARADIAANKCVCFPTLNGNGCARARQWALDNGRKVEMHSILFLLARERQWHAEEEWRAYYEEGNPAAAPLSNNVECKNVSALKDYIAAWRKEALGLPPVCRCLPDGRCKLAKKRHDIQMGRADENYSDGEHECLAPSDCSVMCFSI